MQKTEVGTFEVVATNVILEEPTVALAPSRPVGEIAQKTGRFVVGDIARLADGRLLGRALAHDVDGMQIYEFGLVDPDSLRWQYHPIVKPQEAYDNFKVGFNEGAMRLEELVPQCDTDLAGFVGFIRFREAYPDVWAKLAPLIDVEIPSKPTPLFPPGETIYPRPAPSSAGGDPRAMMKRHTFGDFGDFGHFDPTPVSSEEAWTDGYGLSQARRNSIAILTGRGSIRSKFGPSEVLTVRTMRGPRTLVNIPKVR